MTIERIYVYGASGHGKVVADALLTGGAVVAGFVDDGRATGGAVLGLPVCGDGEWLRDQARDMGIGVALGIGDNLARRAVAARCVAWGLELVTAVHPSATVARSATLGAGVVVMAGAVVNPDARVGRGAIINTGAVVEHDVAVGDFAHLSPNASSGGAASVGDLAHLGLGATVLPGVRVGRFAVIGAGAVVLRDVPDGAVATGVPAVVRRFVEIREGHE